MTPEAHQDVLRVAHSHPGRVRLRSAAFIGGEAAASRARDALRAAGMARRVEHDARTGSLLVEYEPGQSKDTAIAARAAQAAGLGAASHNADKPRCCRGEQVLEISRRANAATYELTGHRIELRLLVPATLAGLSAVSLVFGQGPILPRWDSLAYWSVSLFALLHGAEINAAARAAKRPEGKKQ